MVSFFGDADVREGTSPRIRYVWKSTLPLTGFAQACGFFLRIATTYSLLHQLGLMPKDASMTQTLNEILFCALEWEALEAAKGVQSLPSNQTSTHKVRELVEAGSSWKDKGELISVQEILCSVPLWLQPATVVLVLWFIGVSTVAAPQAPVAADLLFRPESRAVDAQSQVLTLFLQHFLVRVASTLSYEKANRLVESRGRVFKTAFGHLLLIGAKRIRHVAAVMKKRDGDVSYLRCANAVAAAHVEGGKPGAISPIPRRQSDSFHFPPLGLNDKVDQGTGRRDLQEEKASELPDDVWNAPAITIDDIVEEGIPVEELMASPRGNSVLHPTGKHEADDRDHSFASWLLSEQTHPAPVTDDKDIKPHVTLPTWSEEGSPRLSQGGDSPGTAASPVLTGTPASPEGSRGSPSSTLYLKLGEVMHLTTQITKSTKIISGSVECYKALRLYAMKGGALMLSSENDSRNQSPGDVRSSSLHTLSDGILSIHTSSAWVHVARLLAPEIEIPIFSMDAVESKEQHIWPHKLALRDNVPKDLVAAHEMCVALSARACEMEGLLFSMYPRLAALQPLFGVVDGETNAELVTSTAHSEASETDSDVSYDEAALKALVSTWGTLQLRWGQLKLAHARLGQEALQWYMGALHPTVQFMAGDSGSPSTHSSGSQPGDLGSDSGLDAFIPTIQENHGMVVASFGGATRALQSLLAEAQLR